MVQPAQEGQEGSVSTVDEMPYFRRCAQTAANFRNCFLEVLLQYTVDRGRGPTDCGVGVCPVAGRMYSPGEKRRARGLSDGLRDAASCMQLVMLSRGQCIVACCIMLWRTRRGIHGQMPHRDATQRG